MQVGLCGTSLQRAQCVALRACANMRPLTALGACANMKPLTLRQLRNVIVCWGLSEGMVTKGIVCQCLFDGGVQCLTCRNNESCRQTGTGNKKAFYIYIYIYHFMAGVTGPIYGYNHCRTGDIAKNSSHGYNQGYYETKQSR